MMKRALLPVILALICGSSLAQKSFGGLPVSFNSEQSITAKKTNLVHLTKPEMSAIVEEDYQADKQSYRVGVNLPVSINMENTGNWSTIGNTRVWTVKIKVDDAQALGLYMNEYFIPKGGKLFAYNKNKAQVLGAFTSETPSLMAMEMVEGDELTLEYNQPIYVDETPVFDIAQVVYFYRGVEDRIGAYRDYEYLPAKADACQVNVSCPEGDNHQDQINSVVHYTFSNGSGSFVCSGSLVVNTSYDCTPYILTAAHCGEKTQTSDFNTNVWYFNYQNPNCDPGTTQQYQKPPFTAVGATFRASSINTWGLPSGQQVSGTDFTLVELNSTSNLPANAYYAGWTRETTPSSNGVGVHHPAGHDKKISTYTNPLISATYNGGVPGAHWRVQWTSTQSGHGVTEGGSSGSPLFNPTGLVVGVLSGGSSFCQTPNFADLYGKISASWDPAGSSPDGRLKDWLDPGNTGVMKTFGIATPCSDYLSVPKEEAEGLKLFPNPSNGLFKLTNLEMGENTIEIRDLNGKLIQLINTSDSEIQFDLSAEAKGVYLVKVSSSTTVQTIRFVKD